jgi:hypothetical protein
MSNPQKQSPSSVSRNGQSVLLASIQSAYFYKDIDERT